MAIETVRLKNGSEEAKVGVPVMMFTLRNLMKANPIAFYEAVMVARDRTHKPFGNTGHILQSFSLATPREDGTAYMHETVRNIIASAVTGDGLDMVLGDPIQE